MSDRFLDAKVALKVEYNLTDEQLDRIFENFLGHTLQSAEDEYKLARVIENFLGTSEFKINENVFEYNKEWNDEVHYFMRLVATEKMKEVFKALKIDLNDANVSDEDEGNIGTPGRIIKMWAGADTHDDRELLGGRFAKPVRLAKFPNKLGNRLPIIKEVDLTAVCSHHLAPFSTKFSDKAKVIIAYIPDKFVLGISKLQRVVRHIAQRGWLQEDLTKAIYDEIAKTAETDSVYVKLKNIKHSCEFLRGALSDSDGFTTEYYGGKFMEDPALLDMVRNY